MRVYTCSYHYLSFKNIFRTTIPVIFLLGALLLSKNLFCQNADTSNLSKHSPRKAAIMSACLPGLGQVYNKKYWKVPVIYAGGAVVSYFIIQNSRFYSKYRNAYLWRTDSDPTTIDDYVGKYSDESLLQLKNYYRRNIELTVIAATAVYLLNIIDATVDAHLYDFNVDENLAMRIAPSMMHSSGNFVTGITLSLSFN